MPAEKEFAMSDATRETSRQNSTAITVLKKVDSSGTESRARSSSRKTNAVKRFCEMNCDAHDQRRTPTHKLTYKHTHRATWDAAGDAGRALEQQT